MLESLIHAERDRVQKLLDDNFPRWFFQAEYVHNEAVDYLRIRRKKILVDGMAFTTITNTRLEKMKWLLKDEYKLYMIDFIVADDKIEVIIEFQKLVTNANL